jgi:hypothetical protein
MNMVSTTTNMLINNTTDNKSLVSDLSNHMEELFDVSWNDILYDGGLATWLTRSSFRWLTISVCLIGIIGKLN